MMTAKKSAVFAVPLILVGLLGAVVAQESESQDERAASRSDELQGLLQLLDLQERQLDLVQQQILLTKQRVQAITERGPEAATIEIEAKIVEIVTKEPGEFERLLSLPEHGGGFPVVLDGEKYEALLAKIASVEGVSVVSRPKVAVRDGVQGKVVNTSEIPFFGPDGQLHSATVGFAFSFGPRVFPSQTIVMTVDVEGSKQVGQSVVALPDGTEVAVPLISEMRTRNHVRLENGQGVVLGGLVVTRGLEYTHVLYFVRPRVLPAGEDGEF